MSILQTFMMITDNREISRLVRIEDGKIRNWEIAI